MDKQFWRTSGLGAAVGAGLAALGYEAPTAVQARVIPAALAGRDLIVQADTGSGKTAAFAIPVCERVAADSPRPQALVLTPTRELAVQVQEEIAGIGRFKQLRTLALYGRQPIARQTDRLRQKVQVVVGTPGRVLDHILRGTLPVEDIRLLVLDEADRMLDMGFWEQVGAILARLPVPRQTLLFSATMPAAVRELAGQFMIDPAWCEVESAQPAVDLIEQGCCVVAAAQKVQLIEAWLCACHPASSLLFCNTREQAAAVAAALAEKGYACAVLHGGLEQRQRLETLDWFKRGLIPHLVATDVAARGIHADGVELVISCDVPEELENYVHRIGRTGRAGKSGRALLLATPEEAPLVARLEVYLGYALPRLAAPTAAAIESGCARLAEQAGDRAVRAQLVSKLRINGGKQKKIRPGDLVGAITSLAGVSAADIGLIDVQDTCAYVEILGGKGQAVLDGLASTPIKGRVYKVKLV